MSESVDLVDRAGVVRVTGAPRAEADNIPGLHMQIVIVVVIRDGRVLAQQRALTKSVDPGAVDHVCGAVLSGETPEAAARREALEEAGVRLRNTRMVTRGVNGYGRYRYLLSADTLDTPRVVDPGEVAWVGFRHVAHLLDAQKDGEVAFTKDYFADLRAALGVA